jgi:uncharacterized membrane protein YcaP (DUF421 family)
MAAMLTALAADGMVHDLLAMQIPVTEKVIRTIAVYVGILLVIRLAGKRLMAQMNSLDLVVVLLLSNVVQNAVIGDDNTLVGGLLGAVVLVVVNSVLDRLAQVVPLFDRLLNGSATLVVQDGHPDDAALLHLGMTRQELGNALQRQGVDDIADVETAHMEPGGTLTVKTRPGSHSASIDDLRRAVEELTARLDASGQRGTG